MSTCSILTLFTISFKHLHAMYSVEKGNIHYPITCHRLISLVYYYTENNLMQLWILMNCDSYSMYFMLDILSACANGNIVEGWVMGVYWSKLRTDINILPSRFCINPIIYNKTRQVWVTISPLLNYTTKYGIRRGDHHFWHGFLVSLIIKDKSKKCVWLSSCMKATYNNVRN